jgi:hypothetical protein
MVSEDSALPPYRKVRDRMGHPFSCYRKEKQILRYAQDDNLPRSEVEARGELDLAWIVG